LKGLSKFVDVSNQLIQAGIRMAGDATLPDELETLKNLLLKGAIEDATGRVTITPYGQVEIQPADSPFTVRASAGFDPSIYVGYQSKKPVIEGRTPEFALDEALRALRQEY